MEKLNFEDIAPYLPYKLKCFCNNEVINDVVLVNKIFTLTELKTNTMFPYWTTDKNFTNQLECIGKGFLACDLKPILRPLSDLTKEIEVSGKKFVPALILWDVDVREEEAFDIYGEIPAYWKECMNLDFRSDFDYRTMKCLFKLHFDVFSLIEKGQAIDINTLSNG